MHKIILAGFLVVLTASTSFGAASQDVSVATADTGKTVKSGTASIGKCSTGVGIGWNTGEAGYAIITQHINGVKAFGTSHDSTAITWKAVPTKGTGIGAVSASDSSAVSGSGWSVM